MRLRAISQSEPPPSNCVAEEVRRNLASCKFIKDNKLYTQADLAKAFSGPTITFPKEAVELKMDWMPVDTVAAWLNNNGESVNGASVTADFVRKNYFITKQPDGTEYAMVSMHISTKDRPNWLWATFEHQSNPGRCDTTGCYDDYGAPVLHSKILPRQVANTQYPDCVKSAELSALFAKAGLPKVWANYCLKGTQIDFVSTQPLTKGTAAPRWRQRDRADHRQCADESVLLYLVPCLCDVRQRRLRVFRDQSGPRFAGADRECHAAGRAEELRLRLGPDSDQLRPGML